jgi:spermidine synthase
MIPWQHLDTAAIPGGAELRLFRRGAEFSIRLGPNELMNSRMNGSEIALATLALARLTHVAAPSILIGGLGMGFTLRAALGAAGPKARIAVAELVPAVIAWARGPMAALTGDSLEDRRLALIDGDVGAVIAAGRSAYDAILLDVDNGPEAMTRGANDGLYGPAGLAAARAALRPGGILAVWSQGPEPAFNQRLRLCGFRFEEVRVRATISGGGARHVIWLATPEAETYPAARTRRGRS